MTHNETIQQELAQRNAEIAKATLHFIQENGYRVMWDGEHYIVYTIGLLCDDEPTQFKFKRRDDAYTKALYLAAECSQLGKAR
jgi:hypothetical protein